MSFIKISFSSFKAFAAVSWKLILNELITKISALQKYSLCLSLFIVESNWTKYGALENCYTFICYIFFFFYDTYLLLLLHVFPAYGISWHTDDIQVHTSNIRMLCYVFYFDLAWNSSIHENIVYLKPNYKYRIMILIYKLKIKMI